MRIVPNLRFCIVINNTKVYPTIRSKTSKIKCPCIVHLLEHFYDTTHRTGLVTHYQRFVIILLFACSCGMSALNSIKRFQISVKMEYFFFFSKIAFDAF